MQWQSSHHRLNQDLFQTRSQQTNPVLQVFEKTAMMTLLGAAHIQSVWSSCSCSSVITSVQTWGICTHSSTAASGKPSSSTTTQRAPAKPSYFTPEAAPTMSVPNSPPALLQVCSHAWLQGCRNWQSRSKQSSSAARLALQELPAAAAWSVTHIHFVPAQSVQALCSQCTFSFILPTQCHILLLKEHCKSSYGIKKTDMHCFSHFCMFWKVSHQVKQIPQQPANTSVWRSSAHCAEQCFAADRTARGETMICSLSG